MVARDATRQELGLPERHRQRQRLERDERLAQRRAPVDALPAGEEAAERSLLGRLDFAPQRGERGPAQAAKNVRVAPFPLRAARAQLAADELVRPLERRQLLLGDLELEAEALGCLRGRERAARAREAQEERGQRLVGLLEERRGKTTGRHCPERVPVAPGVLGRDEHVLSPDPHFDGAPLAQERLSQLGLVLAPPQVPGTPELVVELVGAAGVAQQLPFDLLHGVGIEQVAQFLLPQQLA